MEMRLEWIVEAAALLAVCSCSSVGGGYLYGFFQVKNAAGFMSTNLVGCSKQTFTVGPSPDPSEPLSIVLLLCLFLTFILLTVCLE